MTAAGLPAVNASLNGLSALLLGLGYAFIRNGRKEAHRACMLAAFASSCVFLGCYLYYHFHVGRVPFPGSGWPKVAYLSILLSHTTLALAVVPLALRALYFASRNDFARHRSVARKAFPIWMYVSVTGIVVYMMLYRL